MGAGRGGSPLNGYLRVYPPLDGKSIRRRGGGGVSPLARAEYKLGEVFPARHLPSRFGKKRGIEEITFLQCSMRKQDK